MEIKICGITNSEDALCAVEAGADYIGFVFYEKSPRAISIEKACDIAKKVKGKVKIVGVFVNKNREDVMKIATSCQLDIVQLHGDELARDFVNFPLPIWRAIRCSDNSLSPSPTQWGASRYVVDSMVKDSYGGSGVICDWKMAAHLAAKFPIMLSGGLNCKNVQEAILTVKPLGVDVSSGIESAPGKKDKTKIKNFISLVKAFENNSIHKGDKDGKC